MFVLTRSHDLCKLWAFSCLPVNKQKNVQLTATLRIISILKDDMMMFTKLDHVMMLTLFSPRRAKLLNLYGQLGKLLCLYIFYSSYNIWTSPKFIHKFMGLFFVFFITTYVCAYTKSRPV